MQSQRLKQNDLLNITENTLRERQKDAQKQLVKFYDAALDKAREQNAQVIADALKGHNQQMGDVVQALKEDLTLKCVPSFRTRATPPEPVPPQLTAVWPDP